MGVWGVWVKADSRFYFSTGAESMKARNLLANPYCVICTENAGQPVVLEGTAAKAGDVAKPIFKAYKKKYGYDLDPALGPIFAVTPRVAFGLMEYHLDKTATRWRFKTT